MLPSDRLATIEEVATYLRTTPNALTLQRHRNQPPGSLAIKIGARLLWNPEHLEAWLIQQNEA